MNADALKRLWAEAFGDTEEAINAFFDTGYSPDRHHFISENGALVSALYWFDCHLDGQKLAYIYAVATAKSHRGKGFARRLMEETHRILQNRGYAGTVLVPGGKELFAFYAAMGYRTASTVTEFTCTQADKPAALTEIATDRYTKLRNTFLPTGGVAQEGAALAYLHTYARFYEGQDFLLAAVAEGSTLYVQELLGNRTAAPEILRALSAETGHFRTPGTGRDFAMYLPLTDSCPRIGYFGLALD